MNIKLTLSQAAQLLGKNQGQVLQAIAKDCKHHDPSFPACVNGSFQLADLLAWRAAKDGTAAVAATSNPPADQGTAK